MNLGPDHQIIDSNSKTALAEFSEIDSQGGCCSRFLNEMSQKN